MFTGIIEETGVVESIQKGPHSAVLSITAKKIMEGTKEGDSIAVNGVCLTVSKLTPSGFCADVMPETIRSSSFDSLTRGCPVNLERALPANGRFGGHIVTGHIDGTGRIRSILKEENAICYRIAAPNSILQLIIPKGSIAVDGISLTIAKVTADSFFVSVIPHTALHTTLSLRRIGDVVNLENDCIGKYVALRRKNENISNN